MAGVAIAAWAGALAGLAALAYLGVVRSRRRAGAAAWRDAMRISELMRAGAVGELAESLVQELGTPVASLLNNLGAARRLLARGERADLPEVIAAVDEAHSAAERTARVIREVRLLHGTDAGRWEPLDVSELVREAIRLVGQHAAMGRVELRAELDRRLPPLRGDAPQLLQVALGLVLNAVDAAVASRARAVTVRTALSGDGIELAVGNSGASLSESDRTLLFDQRSSMAPSGRAIGLAMIRAIVEAHGGQVGAERPVSGALFRVVLPLPPGHGAGAPAGA